jgi:serine/threonine protein kinase
MEIYTRTLESMGILCWRDIVDMLWSISEGLKVIHEHDLVNGYLHGGNILVENGMDSIEAKITDTGLHGPADSSMSSQQIYGVVPFVAPEIFNKNLPTKASDIYSFGMIMWMLSAGARPYCDRPHDKQLIQEICSGLRPNIITGTPTVFFRLMLQCLNANPTDRPTASQICKCLENWRSNLPNQFGDEFVNLEKINLWVLPYHDKAIYFSRLLDFESIFYEKI